MSCPTCKILEMRCTILEAQLRSSNDRMIELISQIESSSKNIEQYREIADHQILNMSIDFNSSEN